VIQFSWAKCVSFAEVHWQLTDVLGDGIKNYAACQKMMDSSKMVEWTPTSGPNTSQPGGVNDFGIQRSQHYRFIHCTGVNASTIMR